jgi:hypothetical protein
VAILGTHVHRSFSEGGGQRAEDKLKLIAIDNFNISEKKLDENLTYLDRWKQKKQNI